MAATTIAADLGSPYQKFMRHIATKGNDYEIQKRQEMGKTGKVVWFPRPIEYFKRSDESTTTSGDKDGKTAK
ncbi:hypothetical protein NADFUDRAFT_84437 [Nadsonia fulvescens var. elongata DSM 6958]|uniref:Uncharacterized protein n=1 Tax=Nadsonia fulvescens var. elongata DSM 6958 TaxID=857566 RepID=A0A1E3PDA4_9ASCO|nr:hypothetical protein NADFUDRAFT_84437 [Nadsonia fulvescens var. elongata DSM 6958]